MMRDEVTESGALTIMSDKFILVKGGAYDDE